MRHLYKEDIRSCIHEPDHHWGFEDVDAFSSREFPPSGNIDTVWRSNLKHKSLPSVIRMLFSNLLGGFRRS